MSAARRSAAAAPARGWAWAWSWTKRLAPWLLSALVLGLLARQLHTIAWPEVWAALRQQPRGGLLAAVGLALLSYALVAGYDLIGRGVTGHQVPVPRTLRIAAICYAFNVNFGALIGAMALRLRLYGREGVDAPTTGRVIATSVLGNWAGYLLLGGGLLLVAPPPMPAELPLSDAAVRAIGALMLALALGYLALCWSSPAESASRHGAGAGRVLAWRGHSFALPERRLALAQLLLSASNWALMGLIVWVLLQQQLPYATVLGVLLLAAGAGVATHVPAGLGVLEAVFLSCLHGELPSSTLLAALLAYRATYYLVPLVLAGLAYGLGEMANTARPAAAQRAAAAP